MKYPKSVGKPPIEFISFPILLFFKSASVMYNTLRTKIDKHIFPRQPQNDKLNIKYDIAYSDNYNGITHETIHLIKEQNEQPVNLEELRDKCLIVEFDTSSAEKYQKSMNILFDNASIKNFNFKSISTKDKEHKKMISLNPK